MEIRQDDVLGMYELMVKIRQYEETLRQAYLVGKSPRFDISFGDVPGEMHLASGQEPSAAWVPFHLTKDDTITAPHRPHHFAIAKGVDLKRMTSEIYGKETGLSKGKGGHMHLFDPAVKFSCSGIVGAGFPPALGAAMAAKRLGKPWVAIAVAGEGAANQGTFHESLNLASLWKLPVVFLIEDNSYAISVTKRASTAIPYNSDRAAAYGIPGARVADNDPIAMYEVAGEAVARARRGEGPSLIEIETFRLLGHFEGDAQAYRPEEEIPSLQGRDSIQRLRTNLMGRGWLDEARDQEIRERTQREIDEAFAFARESPYPAPEAALEDVFV